MNESSQILNEVFPNERTLGKLFILAASGDGPVRDESLAFAASVASGVLFHVESSTDGKMKFTTDWPVDVQVINGRIKVFAKSS